MSKVRLSVSVDESVKQQLDARSDINTSGLVNDLLKSYLATGEKDATARQMKAERLRQEAQELKAEHQAKMRQAETIEQEIQEEQEAKAERWQEAVNAIAPKLEVELSSVDAQFHDPEPTDPAVQHHAERLDITTREFCERFHDKRVRYYDDSGTPERGVQ